MNIFDRVAKTGIMPVIKIPAVEAAVPLAGVLLNTGIPQIEVTLRNPCALECIAEIKRSFPEMLVAAGTVLRTEQVLDAKAAGAELIVTPGLNEEIVRFCQEYGIPVLPGCVTPTEIDRGLNLGLTTFKFFPSEPMGGIHMIRELARPYPQAKFVPTCGITIENLRDYLAVPCVASVGGSFMAPSDKLAAGDWEGIRQLCERTVKISEETRNRIEKTVPQSVVTKVRTRQTAKVVGFGDFLVRLSPPGYLRLRQARSLDLNYTGAEANVLVSLACMDVAAEFVTRLPENLIADSGIDELRRFGIGTEHIVRGGERMGIFYAEKGASQRPSRIVYDRKYSGIAMAEPWMFDWDQVFVNATHFHVTGITPALGKYMPDVTVDAVKKAKEYGLVVSCDLNYRSNMWSPEEARDCIEKILQHVDILIANEEDADKVLGIHAQNTDVTAGKLDRDGYVDVAAQLCKEYGVKSVGITLRKSVSASDNEWGALLYTRGKPYFSKTYPIHIVDRVGGGDSFAAGLIYGDIFGFEPQRQIEFAAAASCLKHSIEMDFNLSSVTEIELLMNGDASGRVRR